MVDGKPGRFGYLHIVERLAELHREAQSTMQLGPVQPGAAVPFDRRQVLRRLCQAFDADEGVLLRRGFDRAYRRIVEGV